MSFVFRSSQAADSVSHYNFGSRASGQHIHLSESWVFFVGLAPGPDGRIRLHQSYHLYSHGIADVVEMQLFTSAGSSVGGESLAVAPCPVRNAEFVYKELFHV